ncbi:MAG: tetratricopeptide repeat protein [Phycisphaera sp.]|nr:tetratricopeptide repeat protein [Phycisphaera sp.]
MGGRKDHPHEKPAGSVEKTPAANAHSSGPLDRVKPRHLYVVLVLVCLGVWSSSLEGKFTFDDDRTILMRGDHWGHESFWSNLTEHRPLISASLWLNFNINRALGRDGFDVTGYHVWNITAHTLSAVLLMALVVGSLRIRLNASRVDETRSTRTQRQSLWIGFVCALLWALHPLQTQAVTYIIQRCESMMGLFLLLAMFGFYRVAMSQNFNSNAPQSSTPRFAKWAWGTVVVIATLASLGCKEVAVVIPALLPLYDRVFVAKRWRDVVVKRGLLHVAVWLVVLPTVLTNMPVTGPWIQSLMNSRTTTATPDLTPTTTPQFQVSAGFSVPGMSARSYAISQPAVILHYLKLSFWPRGQNIDYMWLQSTGLGQSWPSVALIVVLLGVTAVALWRWPRAGFCAASFFIVLAPTSSIVPIADLAMEHRMYIPLAAVVVLGVTGAARLLANIRANKPRLILAALFVLALSVGLTATTVQRNTLYHDPLNLWQDSVAQNPRNARASYYVGIELAKRNNIEGALDAFAASLNLDPTRPEVRRDYATTVARMGFIAEATRQFQLALAGNPNDPMTLSALGRLYLDERRFAEARDMLVRCVQLRPDHADDFMRLGYACLQLGTPSDAAAALKRAIDLGGGDSQTHNLLGLALSRMDQYAQAALEFRAALQLDPNNADAARNLAIAQAELTRLGTPAP